ncbi:MAG: hypothetical protein LUO79_01885 [Methanomassiliicoccales archaeon]|nr:hypothetical protein [Methanomassiliicoccales archaeon]
MRIQTLRYVAIAGVVLLFVALILPFGSLPFHGPELLGGYINEAGIGVKIAALLLYAGAIFLLLTRRFHTFVLVGGISLVLIAAEYDSKVATADFGIGMGVLIAGVVLATAEVWWKAIAEAFEDEEEPDESDSGRAD